MERCDEIRYLIYRVVEGEATPEQAMRVARHLPDCTACKIVQAREYRLATMLEQELQDLPVSEDFVHSVMNTLPEGPPPARRRPDDRKGSGRGNWAARGLKLALFAFVVLGPTLLVMQATMSDSAPSLIGLADSATTPDAWGQGVSWTLGEVARGSTLALRSGLMALAVSVGLASAAALTATALALGGLGTR